MTTETATMQGKTYRVGDKWTSYRVMVGVQDAGPRTADYQPASDPEMAEWLSHCYQRGARSVEVELVREDGKVVEMRYNYQMERNQPVAHREQTTVAAWKHTPKGGWKVVKL